MSVSDYVSAWKFLVSRTSHPLFFSSDGCQFLLSDEKNSFMNFWLQTSPIKQGFSSWFLGRTQGARAKAAQHPPSAVLCVDENMIISGWENVIRSAGYRKAHNLTGMELQLPDGLVPPIRPKQLAELQLRIERASESDSVSRDFAVLNSDAYHVPHEEFAFLHNKSYWKHPNAFVAYVGKEPAATVFVFPISETRVYVAWVATAEKHRKKGIAEALLRFALAKVSPSVTTAVLHASDMGQPLYARLGFVAVSSFAFLECEKEKQVIDSWACLCIAIF